MLAEIDPKGVKPDPCFDKIRDYFDRGGAEFRQIGPIMDQCGAGSATFHPKPGARHASFWGGVALSPEHVYRSLVLSVVSARPLPRQLISEILSRSTGPAWDPESRLLEHPDLQLDQNQLTYLGSGIAAPIGSELAFARWDPA